MQQKSERHKRPSKSLIGFVYSYTSFSMSLLLEQTAMAKFPPFDSNCDSSGTQSWFGFLGTARETPKNKPIIKWRMPEHPHHWSHTLGWTEKDIVLKVHINQYLLVFLINKPK